MEMLLLPAMFLFVCVVGILSFRAGYWAGRWGK